MVIFNARNRKLNTKDKLKMNYLHLLIGSEEPTQQLPIYDDEMEDENDVM